MPKHTVNSPKLGFFENDEYYALLYDFLGYFRVFLVKLGAKTFLADYATIHPTDRAMKMITPDSVKKAVVDARRDCERTFEAILAWQGTKGQGVQEMSYQKIMILLLDEERWDVYHSSISTARLHRTFETFDDFEKQYQEILTRRITGQPWAL